MSAAPSLERALLLPAPLKRAHEEDPRLGGAPPCPTAASSDGTSSASLSLVGIFTLSG